MRFYMAYSASADAHEGAILVVAHNAREAKSLAWRRIPWGLIAYDYTDLRVKWIKDEDNVRPLANQSKLADRVPHVVDSPLYCVACNVWGAGLDREGACANCGEYPGDELIDRLKGDAAWQKEKENW